MDHSSSECLFELFYKIDPSVILDIYQFHHQDFDKTVSALIDINSEINIDENEELLATLEQYNEEQEVVEERNEINNGINDGNSAFFDVGSGRRGIDIATTPLNTASKYYGCRTQCGASGYREAIFHA